MSWTEEIDGKRYRFHSSNDKLMFEASTVLDKGWWEEEAVLAEERTPITEETIRLMTEAAQSCLDSEE